jgi:hypothetical protein
MGYQHPSQAGVNHMGQGPSGPAYLESDADITKLEDRIPSPGKIQIIQIEGVGIEEFHP